MGAVLAVPLTLFVHAILVGQDPDRRWARVLLAGTSGAATEGRAARRHRGRRAGDSSPSKDGAEPGEPPHPRRWPSRPQREPARPSADEPGVAPRTP
jgi:AI-2 transport protein TqsA